MESFTALKTRLLSEANINSHNVKKYVCHSKPKIPCNTPENIPEFIIPASYKDMRRSLRVSLIDEIMDNSVLPFYHHRRGSESIRALNADDVRRNQYEICLLSDQSATGSESVTGSGGEEFEEYHVGPISKYIAFPKIVEIPSVFHQIENPKHGAFYRKTQNKDLTDAKIETEIAFEENSIIKDVEEESSMKSLSEKRFQRLLKIEDLRPLSFAPAGTNVSPWSPVSETESQYFSALQSPATFPEYLDSDSEFRWASAAPSPGCLDSDLESRWVSVAPSSGYLDSDLETRSVSVAPSPGYLDSDLESGWVSVAPSPGYLDSDLETQSVSVAPSPGYLNSDLESGWVSAFSALSTNCSRSHNAIDTTHPHDA